ncbi:hypothetical protein D3C78_905680 [compost metagenome]
MKRSAVYFYTFLVHRVHQLVVLGSPEQALIFYCNAAAIRQQLYILVQELNLLHLGRLSAVSIDNPVRTEVIVGRAIAEISTVCKEFLAITILLHNDLIDVIPDKSALIHRILVLQLRILMHTAERVGHRMHIFTAYIRLARIVLQIGFNIRWLRIHPALHVA